MQHPPENSALVHYRRSTAYTGRRLRVSGKVQMAEDGKRVFQVFRTSWDTVEDAEEPVQEALADRDAADAMLDPACEEASRMLGARAPDAKRTSPWKDIFPDAMAYYTAAPVGEEVKRYTQFADRLLAHLPPNDPVLVSVLPRIQNGLEKWRMAEEALRKATVALEAARTKRERAEEDWRTFMDRLYANLRAELGKEEAESFFRRQTRRPRGEVGDAD